MDRSGELRRSRTVFNDSKMNDAVWKFRTFKEPSLRYGDQGEVDGTQGGWNVKWNKRFARLIEAELLAPDDQLEGENGTIGFVTADRGIAVDGIRQEGPDEAAVAAGAEEPVDGWAFWGLKELAQEVNDAEEAVARWRGPP
jgi:hypothetical protein